MTKYVIAMLLVGAMVSISEAKSKTQGSIRKPASLPVGNVQVGGNEEEDACGSSGIALASTTLVQRSKSGDVQFNTVPVNAMVYMCDYSGSEDSAWIGVVYGKKNQDCGVSSPIKDRQDYKGPCKSGWIKKSFIELVAG
ncbi:hypothetical protein [Bdellovibrio bacteriovorus]|uniref:hypothetical protein n=1 Tax=Bdellovibrio TaxID=958 RepID=UPI0035A965FF